MTGHSNRQLARAIGVTFQSSFYRAPLSDVTTRLRWICQSCRSRRDVFQQPSSTLPPQPHVTRRISFPARYSSSARQQQEAKSAQALDPELKAPATSTATTLPSHNERQRWQISKRWSIMMDSMLARASIAGQHINNYTGTDYSGIEALRKDILAKEQQVREQHDTVGEAKEEHVQARKKQAASQKEIVGLLERKSSWTPSDLERYMTLVRSEHIDDQAVQKAAEGLAGAERQLESTRSLLEKLERQQYHEEQIWSDTIRRNSTWVTIGLMGINIVLLLAQISIFEPYRRRRIVDQIEQALDHKVALGLAKFIPITEPAAASTPAHQQAVAAENVGTALMAQAEDPSSHTTVVVGDSDAPIAVPILISEQSLVQRAKATLLQFFSDQSLQMKQYDRTMLVLESAVAGIGVALLGSALVLRSGLT